MPMFFFTEGFLLFEGNRISRPANGRTSGCRRSYLRFRGASDRAFARRDDEGDVQANFPAGRVAKLVEIAC